MHYFALSAVNSLDFFGLSYIFTQRNIAMVVQAHTLFPIETHAVIFQEAHGVHDTTSCFTNATLNCVKAIDNPHGIPAWKIFAWTSTEEARQSPLGPRWSLVSAPFSGGQTHLGFALETVCESLPEPIAPSSRKKRAWIHANLETYFWRTHNVWNWTFFEEIGAETGIGFTAALEPGFARLNSYPVTIGEGAVPANLEELDRSIMNREDIMHEVRNSRLLVGLLDPKEWVCSSCRLSACWPKTSG
jgi:hypothetical protein